MNEIDKTKLKVLIKFILIQNYPSRLTARQLSDIINSYDWGFRSPITTRKVGKLLSVELKKHDGHFMENIIADKKSNIQYYSLSSKN